jgi:hypothetical protein
MDQRRSLKQLSNKKQFQVNMKSKLLFALTVATSLFLTSCYNDNEEDLYPAGACELTAVTYATTIKPIMQASCAMAGCHNNATASAGVRLEDYPGLKTIATSGQLIGAINHSSGFSAMPKNMAKLSQCQLDQIKKWVDDGALDN